VAAVTVLFAIAAAVAVIATVMVITRARAIHALLYLVISFLALALVFYVLGAPFIAALEVIIYAGAIIVLFLFALLLINPGPPDEVREREWMRPRSWILPSVLAAVLLFELTYLLVAGGVPGGAAAGPAGPGGAAAQVKAVGVALLGPYVLGVELASILLLAGLVATHRLTQDVDRPEEVELGETAEPRAAEPRAAGPHAPGPHAAGSRAAGPRVAGPRVAGRPEARDPETPEPGGLR
jgi:NADH-quinone oxidoreductase subunit J